MTENIRLVCFDMAGTTVADGGLVDAAFDAAMREVEVPDDEIAAGRDHVHRTMGLPKATVFRALLHDENLVARAVQAFDSSILQQVSDGTVTAVPGAARTFETLRSNGIAVCLTTGFTGDVQSAIVRSLGWEHLVDLVICPSESVRGRPYPDMVLTAVLRLGIDSVAAVGVVGDTSNDLLTGHRAGAGIVAGVLTGAHLREELESVPHTHIIESVADFPAILA